MATAAQGPLSSQRAIVIVAVILIAATFFLFMIVTASAVIQSIIAAPLRTTTKPLSLSDSKRPDFDSRFQAIRNVWANRGHVHAR
jgi:hypothetical protein